MKPLRIAILTMMIVSVGIGFSGLSQGDNDSTQGSFQSGAWIDEITSRGNTDFLIMACYVLGQIVDDSNGPATSRNEPGELGSTSVVIQALRLLEKHELIRWNGDFRGHWTDFEDGQGKTEYQKYCPQSSHLDSAEE